MITKKRRLAIDRSRRAKKVFPNTVAGRKAYRRVGARRSDLSGHDTSVRGHKRIVKGKVTRVKAHKRKVVKRKVIKRKPVKRKVTKRRVVKRKR